MTDVPGPKLALHVPGQLIPAGELVTVPFVFRGRRLEVNIDAGAGGSLKVEILNRNGRPCRGYAEKDADEMWGNDVRRTATWRGKQDVSPLQGKAVRLRFVGERVKLYAFQFAR